MTINKENGQCVPIHQRIYPEKKRKRTRKKFRTVWLVRLFRILFHDRPGNPGTGYLLRVGSGPM